MRISDWSSYVCSSDLGRAVDFLLRIHRSNARKEVAERQHAFDGEVGQAEGRGDILDLAAFLDQADKAFTLRHFIGVEPRHVLDQPGFDGIGHVARSENRAAPWYVVDAPAHRLDLGGTTTAPQHQTET